METYDYNALIFGIFSCFGLSLLYPIVHGYLNDNYDNFRIIPYDKQQYVIKNLIKSGFLFSLCILSLPFIIIPVYTRGYWDSYWCHRFGVLYTANDTTGLMLVNNLPSSTIIHHKITTTLCLISLSIDFNDSSLGQMLFVYTIASAHAYLVNFYLGSRYLYKKKELVYLKRYARNIYICSCICNWGWHIHWIVSNYNFIQFEHAVYFILLYSIIKDDLILMKWLQT